MMENTQTEELDRIKKLGLILFNGTLIVLGLCACTITIGTLTKGESYDGISLFWFLGIIAFVFLMKFLLKNNKVKISCFGFVAIFGIGCTYGALTWGVSMPLTLLGFGLTIVFASTLLGNIGGTIALIYTSIILIIAGTLEIQHGIPPWKTQSIIVIDIIIYAVMLNLTALTSRLSNREIYRSLKKARIAQNILEQEQLKMEFKLDSAVQKLEKTYIEKTAHIISTAEFGKSAQGLMHDLINPINTLTLVIDGLYNNKVSTQDAFIHAHRVKKLISKVNAYLGTISRNIHGGGVITDFSLLEEIKSVVQLHSFRARQADITIALHGDDTIITGDAVQFHHIISILLSNSIETLISCTKDKKHIIVFWKIRPETIVITVKDNGNGMSQEIIEKLFTPFFTTKIGGHGIGLNSAQDRINNHFNGSIRVKSTLNIGTSFICTLYPKYEKNMQNTNKKQEHCPSIHTRNSN